MPFHQLGHEQGQGLPRLGLACARLALDLQGAGTPDTYRLDAFRLAFLTQFPLWALGWTFIVIERRKTRVLLGIDAPRRSR